MPRAKYEKAVLADNMKVSIDFSSLLNQNEEKKQIIIRFDSSRDS